MSKVNPNVKGSGSSSVMMKDTRLAGGSGLKAAKQSSIDLLRRLTLANLLWEDNAYVDGENVANQIAKLIPKCNPDEVASLAIETRKIQKLRHTPLFIAALMLKHEGYKNLVSGVLEEVITRADMITDFLAIYQKVNDGKLKPLASSAKKGLAACFNNFSEYQFAKYDRDAAIKLRDAMFLVHPKPTRGNKQLFKKIADRNLDTPDTWEVALSAGKDKKATWERLINDGKLGALAFLRNLRNMIEADVDHKVIRKGFKTIESQMLLPINFLSAAQHAPTFKADINEMMLRIYKNLPKLKGYSIFVVDLSGSMSSGISGKSDFNRKQVACAMAMLANELCEEVDIYLTAGNDGSSQHKTVLLKNPSRGFDLIDQILAQSSSLGGGGIFTRQCLEYIQKDIKGKDVDRIMIFSDSQDCDRVNTTPKPFATNNYIVDVSAHEHGVNYKGLWTAEISGWSEHFLTYIAALEGNSNNFVDE